MLTVSEAQSLILKHAEPLPAQPTPLAPAALGMVLAEDVASDLDLPPFDKALMDGYALRSADLPNGSGSVQVIEEITAGRMPERTLGPGQAAQIMTGAPIPVGADAVVMVERTRPGADRTVLIDDTELKAGQNILPRARELSRGEVVLRAGAVLRPEEFGLLASVGRLTVLAVPRPSMAVISTGDELIDPGQVPGPGQIRGSNGPMLMALITRAGGVPRSLGIAPDQPDILRARIAEGLQSDILVLSGGVSAGKLDLVPGVLQELGVQAHFHKVSVKPGKPLFFGSRPRAGAAATLVFGLPGNPVSTLVCFELFVRLALRRLAGHAEPGPRQVQATLVEDCTYKTDRETYHPAWLEFRDDIATVRPLPWHGSPDLRSLTRANALVVFPVGTVTYRSGQRLGVVVTDW